MADLSNIFRRPFTEQSAAFRLRLGNLVPTERWDDIERDAHNSAFMVAGANKADLLMDIGAAMDKVITEGTSPEEFERDFRDIVTRRGWHGWTGEGTKAGEAWRIRVMLRTNMATSYAAGRRAQLVEGNFKFWIYFHGGSLEPRKIHLDWNGLVLPPDHPFWITHGPPNGWGCSCFVIGTRSLAGARRLGGDPDKTLPDNWQELDPKTGTLVGIDKGWDYSPGASVVDDIRAMTQKSVNWPFALARAFMDDLPEDIQDLFSSSYRSLPSLADALRRYAQRIKDGKDVPPLKTLGRVTTRHRQIINDLTDIDLKDYHLAIDPSSVRHIFGNHGVQAIEAARGQRAVTAADFRMLGDIFNNWDDIVAVGTSDVGRPVVRFSKRIGDDIFIVVVELRGKKRKIAAVQSMWIRRASGRSPT